MIRKISVTFFLFLISSFPLSIEAENTFCIQEIKSKAEFNIDSLPNIYLKSVLSFFAQDSLYNKSENSYPLYPKIMGLYLSRFIDTLLKTEHLFPLKDSIIDITVIYTSVEIRKSLTIAFLDKQMTRKSVRITYSEGALYSDFPDVRTTQLAWTNNHIVINITDSSFTGLKSLNKRNSNITLEGCILIFSFNPIDNLSKTIGFNTKNPEFYRNQILGW